VIQHTHSPIKAQILRTAIKVLINICILRQPHKKLVSYTEPITESCVGTWKVTDHMMRTPKHSMHCLFWILLSSTSPRNV